MTVSVTISASSTINSETNLEKAEQLAREVDLPFAGAEDISIDGPHLCYTDNGLKLITNSRQRQQTLLFVDFEGGKNGYRLAHDLTIKQPLAKACGLKPGYRPTVLDVTAGLGADSFVLASLGCTVTLCERSPVLFSLLRDGLQRGTTFSHLEAIVKRMELHYQDGKDFILSSEIAFDTIYLDPMYPHRRKQALNSLEMRTIRDVVGDDPDDYSLLEIARRKAQRRTVVKRPKGAPYSGDLPPDFSVTMKNSRFDVYLAPSRPSQQSEQSPLVPPSPTEA